MSHLEDTKAIIEDIMEINRQVSEELWKLWDGTESASRLIFPEIKRRVSGQEESKPRVSEQEESKPRVSEQEARFAYAEALNKRKRYYYSVETPTVHTYQFTGKTVRRRASSDMSLYIEKSTGQLEIIANIEFKGGSNPQAIKKDIEKLLVEDNIKFGNWFHILENSDSGTFESLFNKKFIKSFSGPGLLNRIDQNREIVIIFCFCVLKQKLFYQKEFRYSGSSTGSLLEYAESFFKYKQNMDGWKSR